MQADVLTGILISVGSIAIVSLFGMLVKIVLATSKMMRNDEKRKIEITLLFKGILGMIDALQSGKTNGNVSDIEDEINKYLVESR